MVIRKGYFAPKGQVIALGGRMQAPHDHQDFLRGRVVVLRQLIKHIEAQITRKPPKKRRRRA